MNSDKILQAKNIKAVIYITIVALLISLIVSFVQPPKYKSSAKLLIVFNQENMDTYTAAKTSNYLANLLSEVVYSSSFIDNTFKAGFNLNDNLGVDAESRQKSWKKMVQVKTKQDQGIIFIDVLNADRNQANQFAQAISFTLMNKHALYHGSGSKVEIKMIESPITSKDLAQPKIFNNLLVGFAGGLMLGLAFIIIFPNQKLFAGSREDYYNYNDETIELTPAENNSFNFKLSDNEENDNRHLR